ncbi:hypothetical protein [Streptomyces acidicola]|uniref:hypothetical protein n=1 Tax=Streptomyces acidicola TaxID=2596892 RepID=UPI0034122B20
MKLRHVRAVAVFSIVVIALTGARRSHGGGCDNSDSSSSSSSSSTGGSSGSTTGDVGKDNDYDYGGTTTSGVTAGTSTSGAGSSSGSTGGTSRNRADKDVKIESCELDAARGIVARVRATNSSVSTTYTYKFSVTFRGPDGSPVRTSSSGIPYVAAGSFDTLDVAAAYVPTDAQNTTGVSCRLSAVSRTAA